jgi:hypothetical protein
MLAQVHADINKEMVKLKLQVPVSSPSVRKSVATKYSKGVNIILANNQYFNLTESHHKIELEFETDVEPMVQELKEKWTERQHELEQNTRSAKSA